MKTHNLTNTMYRCVCENKSKVLAMVQTTTLHGPEPADSTSSPFGLAYAGSSGRCTTQAALCLEHRVPVSVTGNPGCPASPLVGESPLTGE